VIAFRLSS
jgi:hypothetical protein